MPDDWTHERLLAFALTLTILNGLSPARVQELGEALLFLTERQANAMQGQAEIVALQADLIQMQADVIQRLSDTLQNQEDVTQHLHDALQGLQAGVLLLGEEEAP